jgi:hypothetical protein
VRARLAIAVCGALLLSRCGCGSEPFALANVDVQPNAATRCVVVVAMGADGGRRSSDRKLQVQPPGTLKVAVFAGELGTDLSLRAEGFSDPRCGGILDEASPWKPVVLQEQGPPPEVTLTIQPEGSCSDGIDGDGDGLIDCADDQACGGKPPCIGPDGGVGGFPYVPSNFAPDVIPVPDAGLVIDCDAGYDTTTASGFFCGSQVPAPVTVTMQGGSQAVLLPVGPMTITDAGRLTVVGSRPLIFAVLGNAQLDGPLLAGAVLSRPGPGGSRPMCLGDGTSGTPGGGGGSGGGGGAYGTPGAWGGLAGSNSLGADAGAGGAPFGTLALVPLVGGCSGGPGGETTTGCLRDGGAGGGAIQLSVAGVLHVSSAIAAPGGGGQGGDSANRCGGGGGGSGGGILLEALRVELAATARLTANGGGGAEGGDDAPSSLKFGGDGRIDGPFPALGGDSLNIASAGGDGGAGSIPPMVGESYPLTTGGGGGGGGSVGRIRINSVQGCTLSGDPALLYSPAPTSNLLGDAGCP